MITRDNLYRMLSEIGFERIALSGEYFQVSFDSCIVAIDCDNEKTIYPESIIVHDKTTSNFEHPENFVVLECVCRLLAKGYRPEHIELEPRWTLGHDAKGGKADILVRDEDGRPLLIIECKTAGTEFNKEKKNTEEDGGQLFSYWQQEGDTRWLALYSSDINKDDELSYKCLTISCSDDANIAKIAEKDTDIHIYRKAKNDREHYEVWRDTYSKQWLEDVIFSEESQAYQIGIPPLRKKQLHDFTPEDRIVNRFEEILRHNNVSDKENAFNRLVALFICKLVDEITKQDFEEVDFQYKQGSDTYESLQDRLQRLHKQGMEEFMKEEIFYVDANYAERLFVQYTGSKRKAAIEDLNRTIRILKFYSNNDFAFKDVHNEELFFQNGKILVEVVQLFQSYRIVYPSKHQFLGDLFEQLLNKGFKQNEGQFFTPTPITRFIWDSLPLQHYIDSRDLPRVIDYACGAGHFLTEAVEAINAVHAHADNTWVEKHIYGVEKDYRLARVSKISMFMNGAGGANIIFGDGLENYAEKGITNGTFDILVANPPYSVSGFKQHLKLKNNAFNIIDKITLDGSEIEALFVERTAQLLKPQGLAAIILPASILSNSSSSYIAAREQLLQNFMLRAIVNFGSKTFGATGTNTVVLFLERYNEPPRVSEMAKDSVDAIMSGKELDNWADKEVLDAYLVHQGMSEDVYLSFINKSISWVDISSDSYLKAYFEAFSFASIKYPKSSTEEEKETIRRTKFFDYAHAIERDKLYYFALVWQQKTLVITAPTDNKEQKTFLGYDWSNRKGAEGIIINTPGGQLYNDADRFATNTLASMVRFSFYGDVIADVPDEIEKYAKTYWLRDMVEFKLPIFSKPISPSVKISESLKTNHPLIRLNDPKIFNLKIGKRIVASQLVDNGQYPVYSANVREPFGYINELLITDFDKDSVLWGIDGDWMVGYVHKDIPFYPTDHCGVIRVLSDKIDAYYLSLVLERVGALHGFSRTYRASTERIASVQIPLPSHEIQLKIVEECKKVDEEFNTSRMTIETYRQKIADIFHNLEVVRYSGGVIINKLAQIIKLSSGKMLSNKNRVSGAIPVFGGNGITGYHNVGFVKEPTIVIGRVGEYCGSVHLTNAEAWITDNALYATDFLISINKKYLYYMLRHANLNKYANRTGQPNISQTSIANVEIACPNIQEQDKIIKEVELYEQEIAKAEKIIESIAMRKQAILDKYLK